MTDTPTVWISREHDADDFWSTIFGSSGQDYEWWFGNEFLGDADWTTPGRVVLSIEDPDTDGKRIRKEIGIDELVAAWNIAVVTCVDTCTGRPLDIENLDACGADCVLQIAVLGKAVYS